MVCVLELGEDERRDRIRRGMARLYDCIGEDVGVRYEVLVNNDWASSIAIRKGILFRQHTSRL